MEAVQVEEASNNCRPLAHIPAWWSGFLFHVLNPRQVCIYTYLSMLWDGDGTCSPTVEQMRDDVGLLSTSMVYEALTVLDTLGFFVREKEAAGDPRTRRNVYHRTTCAHTLLKLVEADKLDGSLRPAPYNNAPASQESSQLVTVGLRDLLGERYDRYDRATPDAKRDVLIEELRAL